MYKYDIKGSIIQTLQSFLWPKTAAMQSYYKVMKRDSSDINYYKLDNIGMTSKIFQLLLIASPCL